MPPCRPAENRLPAKCRTPPVSRKFIHKYLKKQDVSILSPERGRFGRPDWSADATAATIAPRTLRRGEQTILTACNFGRKHLFYTYRYSDSPPD